MHTVDLTPFSYTLKSEEGKANATVFELRPLSGLELLDIMDAAEHGRRAVFYTGLKYGLLGWKNVKGKEGDVKFSDDMEENIGRLNVPTITELYLEIKRRSELSEDEKKN